MFGNVNVVEQMTISKMPQGAASAWAEFDASMVRGSYKPIAYVGTQQVKGINHVFLAEQTFFTDGTVRHIVIVTVNEFNGKYQPVGVEQII